MGTWGTGISSNDTFADIYEQFIDLYNEGISVSEITQKLINGNQEIINIPEAVNDFWYAIALGQWECKELDKDILLKVEHIIETNTDIKVWEELGATKADLKKREKVLNNFLEKLKTYKDKPRKRTKKKLYDSIFKKGDCLIYKMYNNNFGGAFVLTDEKGTDLGTNNIAITTIDKSERPNLEDFKNAEIYIKRNKEISFNKNKLIEKWVDQPQIGHFWGVAFKKENIYVEIIGQLTISKAFKERSDMQLGFGWSKLISDLPDNNEYIKINGKPKKTLKLKKIINKHWL